jgi:hypothetical protein
MSCEQPIRTTRTIKSWFRAHVEHFTLCRDVNGGAIGSIEFAQFRHFPIALGLGGNKKGAVPVLVVLCSQQLVEVVEVRIAFVRYLSA